MVKKLLPSVWMVKSFFKILQGRRCLSTRITQKFSVVLFHQTVNIFLPAQTTMLEFTHRVRRKSKNTKLMAWPVLVHGAQEVSGFVYP